MSQNPVPWVSGGLCALTVVIHIQWMQTNMKTVTPFWSNDCEVNVLTLNVRKQSKVNINLKSLDVMFGCKAFAATEVWTVSREQTNTEVPIFSSSSAIVLANVAYATKKTPISSRAADGVAGASPDLAKWCECTVCLMYPGLQPICHMIACCVWFHGASTILFSHILRSRQSFIMCSSRLCS